MVISIFVMKYRHREINYWYRMPQIYQIIMIGNDNRIIYQFTILTIFAVGYPGSQTGLSEKHQQSENSDRVRNSLKEIVCRDSWSFPH